MRKFFGVYLFSIVIYIFLPPTTVFQSSIHTYTHIQMAFSTFQTLLVVKGLLSIVYGSSWVHYIRKFRQATHHHTGPNTRPLLCREVAPVLRSVLFVVACFSVALGAFACLFSVVHLTKSSILSHTLVLLMAQIVILLVYVYQIQFLRHVASSNQQAALLTSDELASETSCQAIAPDQQEVAWVYGWIVLLFGIVYFLLGLSPPFSVSRQA